MEAGPAIVGLIQVSTLVVQSARTTVDSTIEMPTEKLGVPVHDA